MKKSKYFQDYMPGNVCYGCGRENHDGLKIRSYWEGEEAVCIWHSQDKYNGWQGILNGGVLATLIDCHSMCTAMAAAYRAEEREINSEPIYHYATASLNIKYLKPTSNDHPIEIRATIKEMKGKKAIVQCKVYSNGVNSAVAEAIGVRVYDSSKADNKFIKHS